RSPGHALRSGPDGPRRVKRWQMTVGTAAWAFAMRSRLAAPAARGTSQRHVRSVPAQACRRAIAGPVWSGTLGAELAEKAAVVGSDPLLGEPSLAVEAEDVHEVHDDPGTGGFEAPGGRLRERACEGSFNPGLARDVLALGDDDPPPDGAVVEGRPKGPEVAGQSCVVHVEPAW